MQTFDFTAALPRHTTSIHTQRAYYRWVDRYWSDVVGKSVTRGADRLRRMEMLSVTLLSKHLTAAKFKRWLDALADDGQSRQGLDQARAALVTLADLLADDDILDDERAEALREVSVPAVKKKATPERLLTPDEIRQLMASARAMATSDNQMLRNHAIASMLCTMALRRDELSAAKWADLQLHNDSIMLEMSPGEFVDVPRPVLNILDRWRNAIDNPPRHSPLIRRIWKGGRIAKAGLSPDGIWLIIRNAAQHAGLGHVTPDDLRRSAVANLYRNGVPIDEISRILRHRSLLITERFLAKLPLDDLSDTADE